MIKLFIGGKGSGKTKTLIEMVNNAVTASNGNVVCIEKGEKLRHEVTYNARLMNTDAYAVNNAVEGLKPVKSGTRIVAPNIAKTCWKLNGIQRAKGGRSFGPKYCELIF